MVSREDTVYLIAAACAVGLVLVTLRFASIPADWLWSLVMLAYYAIGVGTGHLYLARRGVAGDITVGSRWRFLTAIGCWLTLGALALFGPNLHIRGVGIDAWVTGIGVVVLVVYWVLEARDGYLTSRPT
ncbi:MAG: hypothetical protein ABEI98_01150 [Halorhabdus sp.]